MAVAFNNSAGSSPDSSGASTVTSFSYTASSGANRLLLVSESQIGGAHPSAISYAAAALTNVGTFNRLDQWKLVAPATGANTLSVTAGSYTNRLTVVADFAGVDQTTPLGTAATGTAVSAAPATASLTCPANGMLWGACHQLYSSGGVAPSATGNTTIAGVAGSSGEKSAGGYASTTGTLSWSTPNSATWYAQGFPINAAGAGGTTISATAGNAVANGTLAAVIRTIPVGTGNSVADGITVGITRVIGATPGNAVADGATAAVVKVISATPGNAIADGVTANIVVSGNTTISATPGNAVANGVTAAVVRTIAATPGNAVADGTLVGIIRRIEASPGNAVADGVTAAITGSVKISCMPGNAVAAGVTASIVVGATSMQYGSGHKRDYETSPAQDNQDTADDAEDFEFMEVISVLAAVGALA